MRPWSAPMTMVLTGILACAGPGSAPPGQDGDTRDVSDLAVPDVTEEGPVGMDDGAVLDDGPAPDVPVTCEAVLTAGLCISAAGCPEWMACLGVGGCEEAPCWGLCGDYPGACLPATLPRPCDAGQDCDPDAVCAGRVLGPQGEVVLSGLCRKRPALDACYEDAHCPEGRRCAGAVTCHLGSPCLGPEYPGRCVEPPPPGPCWDDQDCGNGRHCVGTVWCLPEDTTCIADQAGTCQDLAGCFSDEDCAGSLDGGFCQGAFRCREDAQCAFPDTKGFCGPAPGLRRCWQPDHCGGDWVCRAPLPCPPGSLCHATGAAHPGLCGEAPSPGEGLVVTLATSQVLPAKPFRVVVLNQGSVLVFLDPCFVAVVQYKDDSGQWAESWIPEARHSSCDANSPLWPLPPGSGTAVTFTVDVPDTTYRVQVPYRVGCEQGVSRTEARCASDALAANSMAFTLP